MKTKSLFNLILGLILFLSASSANAGQTAISVAVAAGQDTAPTGISLGLRANWYTGKSIDSLQMVYLPIVLRLQRAREQLNIYYSGSQTFPENTTFHIVHGWRFDSPDEAEQSELFSFHLQMDGIYREEDFIEMKPGESRLFVFNFLDGMTGIHMFTGHWLAPCWAIYAVCTDPDEIVESRTSIVEVNFVP